jgi:hypothetical protein
MATVKIDVYDLKIPGDLNDDLQCHFEVCNGDIINWDSKDEFDLFPRTKEMNEYLVKAGYSLEDEILLEFSW